MFREWLKRWVGGGSLEVAWRAKDPVEAQVLASVLRQAAIPVWVRPRGVPGYEGAVERAQGVFADLVVAGRDLHRARAVLAKFLETPAEP